MRAIRELAQMGWGRSRRARRRTRWDKAALWFRLRYPNAGQVRGALNLLSRHTSRLGFRLSVKDGVALLYIGVSTDAVAHVLEEMARDMGFGLTATGSIPPPLTGRFTLAQCLVEEEALGEGVDAYLIREQLFTLSDVEQSEKGSVFPESVAGNGQGHGPGAWDIPKPVLGIATRPEWTEPTPMELTLADDDDWNLGQTLDGKTLGGRRVRVFGADDSTAEWLAGLVLTRIARQPARLVVIDGWGDLVPQLLSNPQIARLRSAKQVTYLDVNIAGQGGVNPLAARPEEDLAQVIESWRWWFGGLGVAGRALDLLPQATEAGVSDLPALHRWLKSQAGDSFAAAASFRAVLDQLMRNQVVYRWLTAYPVALRAALETGVLFISCPHKGSWHRFQAIRAVLGLVAEPGSDLVLHRIPVAERDLDRAKALRIVINSSTPNHSPAIDVTILTRHDDKVRAEGEAAAILQRLPQNVLDMDLSLAMVTEHIQCLQGGEALIVRDSLIAFGDLGVGEGDNNVYAK